MTVNLAELQIVHLSDSQRFEIHAEGHTAELTYTLHNGTITFLHTGVPPELEGKSIGTKLVLAGLEFARANGLNIKSLCWFVTLHLQRHPEYRG